MIDRTYIRLQRLLVCRRYTDYLLTMKTLARHLRRRNFQESI